jgi:hypothetical protein
MLIAPEIGYLRPGLFAKSMWDDLTNALPKMSWLRLSTTLESSEFVAKLVTRLVRSIMDVQGTSLGAVLICRFWIYVGFLSNAFKRE